MSDSVFIRVHDAAPERKGDALRSRVASFRADAPGEQVFAPDVGEFAVVPGSPFAYWVSDAVRDVFRRFKLLEGNAGTVKQGLATADDFRFVRAWWEIHADKIGYSVEDSCQSFTWVHFSKGGQFSPFYADVHLLLRWALNGIEVKAWAESTPGTTHWSRRIVNSDLYFRPGLSFPRRTRRLAPSALPSGCTFSHGGQAAFPLNGLSPAALVGLLASAPFFGLLRIQLPRQDADPQFEVGQIQRTPIPSVDALDSLTAPSAAIISLQRDEALSNELLHPFSLPSLLSTGTASLSMVAVDLAAAASERDLARATLQEQIDEQVFALYALPEEERARIRAEVERKPAAAPAGVEEGAAEGDEADDEDAVAPEDLATAVANLLMWCVGVSFGRWDARMARDRSLVPALQGPFERLPRVAPGGLVGPRGLPATEGRIASEAWLRARPNVITLPEPGSFEGPDAVTAAEYPVEVAWDGILVDDEGHPSDIVARVRQVLAYVYGDRAGAIEDEALQVLRGDGKTPRSLRDWLRAQKAAALGKSFHDFHIQRYSKSRRKAPLYWRLTGDPRGGGRYAVWTYFHRLTGDSLYRLLSDYLGPRIRLEEARQAELRREREGKSGREFREIETALEESAELLEELSALERGVRAAAERGWRPEPDDGIVLNLAPLHALTPWKEPEAAWKKLEKGEYDWAKAAMRYWPERVREKCETDRSLAIAHGLDDGATPTDSAEGKE